MAFKIIKDPDAKLDYSLDWSAWLGGDTIATSSFDVPDGLTLDSETTTATTATAWLSGGALGESYEVKNHITTAGGRAEDRTMRITIKEK